MASIRAVCYDCGDVELTTEEVKVRVCVDDNSGSYNFICPVCCMAVVKPAEPGTVELLVASGCQLDRWKLPAELSEPRDGPPISHDDVIDAHELMVDDAALDAALAALLEEE